MIVGEGEIQGQVKAAYGAARAAQTAGRAMNLLFQAALACGKRARARTGLSTGISSTGGAGALSLEEGLARLAEFDVVIGSTSSPEPVLRRDRAAVALRERGGRPIFKVDVAVPRNVEPAAGELDGILLYDIDSLEAIVQESLTRRRGAVAGAEAEVEGRAREFAASRGSDLGLVPALPVPAAFVWRAALAVCLFGVFPWSGCAGGRAAAASSTSAAVAAAPPAPSAGASASAAPTAAPAAAPAPDPALALGAGLYRTKGCVMCHGDDAKGGVQNRYSMSQTIPALERVADGYTKDELREKIKKGVSVVAKADPNGHVPILVMPSWEDKLAADELDAIMGYLFSLAPKDSGGGDDF